MQKQLKPKYRARAVRLVPEFALALNVDPNKAYLACPIITDNQYLKFLYFINIYPIQEKKLINISNVWGRHRFTFISES